MANKVPRITTKKTPEPIRNLEKLTSKLANFARANKDVTLFMVASIKIKGKNHALVAIDGDGEEIASGIGLALNNELLLRLKVLRALVSSNYKIHGEKNLGKKK